MFGNVKKEIIQVFITPTLKNYLPNMPNMQKKTILLHIFICIAVKHKNTQMHELMSSLLKTRAQLNKHILVQYLKF